MSKELDEQGWKDLLSAVRHNRVDEVAATIKDMDAETLSMHECTRSGATLLYEAARLGNEDVLNLLLDKGVDPNVATKRGDRPLESISFVYAQGNTEIIAKYNRMIKRLLQAGAKDEKGQYTSKTDLMCAIQEQNLEKIKKLIAEGADVDATDKFGSPIWEYALRTKNQEIMQALIDGKVNLEQPNHEGKTALMAALFQSRSYKDMAKFLMENGADVNARSQDKSTEGKTPIFFAREPELIDALVQKGANVHAVDAKGETAVWGKSAECLQALHNAGADLKVKNSIGMTLMTDAAFDGEWEIVEFLQQQGFDINAKDDNGMTPLMYAAIGKQQAFEELRIIKHTQASLEFIEQMINAGAKVSITDNQGRTAVDLSDENHPEVKEALEKLLAEEKKALRGDLGLQAIVSQSLENKKVKEAQGYKLPEQPQSETRQNGGVVFEVDKERN